MRPHLSPSTFELRPSRDSHTPWRARSGAAGRQGVDLEQAVDKDEVVSMISRESIDVLKQHFKDDVSKDE
ncbi:hypothetical protein JCM8547_007028 [Rhodosporidiobolus lusitaniae]